MLYSNGSSIFPPSTQTPIFLLLPGHLNVCAYVCSVVSLCDPWTVAHQAPLSLEFSRQKYWSRLPFLTPGDLPNPGIKLTSLASPAMAGDVLYH